MALAPLKLLAAKTFILASLSCPPATVKPAVEVDITTTPTVMKTEPLPDQSEDSAGGVAFAFTDKKYENAYRNIRLPGTELTCLSLSKVKYTFRVTPYMHINHRLPPGKCAYMALKRHYDQIITNSMIGMRDYKPKLERELLESVKGVVPNTPLTAIELMGVKKEFEDKIGKAAEPAQAGMLEFIRQRSAMGDTGAMDVLKKEGCTR
jgi:hypothetical protein